MLLPLPLPLLCWTRRRRRLYVVFSLVASPGIFSLQLGLTHTWQNLNRLSSSSSSSSPAARCRFRTPVPLKVSVEFKLGQSYRTVVALHETPLHSCYYHKFTHSVNPPLSASEQRVTNNLTLLPPPWPVRFFALFFSFLFVCICKMVRIEN